MSVFNENKVVGVEILLRSEDVEDVDDDDDADAAATVDEKDELATLNIVDKFILNYRISNSLRFRIRL